MRHKTDAKTVELANRLWPILEKCRGEEKAVKARDLAERLGLPPGHASEVAIQNAIRHLKDSDKAIAGGVGGYFIPVTFQECVAYLRTIDSRIHSTIAIRNRVARNMGLQDQVRLAVLADDEGQICLDLGGMSA
ncbi:MAG TPA: hypothetical protein GXX28_00805 [Firmicutes bacterium]|nr:hypothetical protein [Bacillota bacterium]